MSSESTRAEAIGLLTGKGVEPDRRELRERVLGRRTGSGSGVGIAGAEVCQACGAIEAFAGLAAAMLKHRKGEYLCSSCLRELSGASAGTYGSAELRRIEGEMSKRSHRFCAGCAREVAQSPGMRRRGVLCVECHGELEALAPDLDALLGDLSRLRYLELRHPTLPDLLEYDRHNEWQRDALDSGWGTKPKQ